MGINKCIMLITCAVAAKLDTVKLLDTDDEVFNMLVVERVNIFLVKK